MLTCDMIYASTKNTDGIILLSGDDDFLPPLYTSTYNGKLTVRFLPRRSASTNKVMSSALPILEMEL